MTGPAGAPDGPGAAVTLAVDGLVAVLTIDRPARRGALDDASIASLGDLLAETARRVAAGGVRAVVVWGAGGAFCAGRDITGVDPTGEDAGTVLEQTVNPVIAALADLPVPTVAAVEGAALGVGLGLALACDLVVAAETARLGSPFGRLGAVLDSGAHLFLADRIGRSRTLELVYTGRLLDGSQAADWGLVNRVVPSGSALTEAMALAGAIAAGPTSAFVTSKRVLAAARDGAGSLAQVLAGEAEGQRRAGRTADYAEGMAAFQAKRTPTFTGR